MEPTSFRTLAYTFLAGCLAIWGLIVSFVVFENWVTELDQNDSKTYKGIGEASHFLTMFVTFFLLPIVELLPTLFTQTRARMLTYFVLTFLTGVILLCSLVLTVIWAFIRPKHFVLENILNLVCQLHSILIYLGCLISLATLRLRMYRGTLPFDSLRDPISFAQSTEHPSHLFLVVGVAFQIASGEGLSSSDLSVSQIFPMMLPLYMFSMLGVVQVRHYTKTHVGWFTERKAKERMNQFTRQYSMTPLEKELANEKMLTEVVIDAVFTKSVYPQKCLGFCK